VAGVWRGPRLGKTVIIPQVRREYWDWCIETEDFDEAWSMAESLSMDSAYPGADALIYLVADGQWEVRLIAQEFPSNGSQYRFHFGDMVE